MVLTPVMLNEAQQLHFEPNMSPEQLLNLPLAVEKGQSIPKLTEVL
jgi:hypothetical protein